MSQRLHSNATYEYNCLRNDRLSAWFWTIRMCLHMIAVAYVYNLYTKQYTCINACANIIPSYIYCLSYTIPHVMIILYIIVYLILCKFSASFGLSTCCIVVLSNYHSLINLATVLHTIIYYCSIRTAEGSAL